MKRYMESLRNQLSCPLILVIFCLVIFPIVGFSQKQLTYDQIKLWLADTKRVPNINRRIQGIIILVEKYKISEPLTRELEDQLIVGGATKGLINAIRANSPSLPKTVATPTPTPIPISTPLPVVSAVAKPTSMDFVKTAQLNYSNKQFDLAIANYTKALELDSKSPDALFGRGKSFFGKGEYALAIADVDMAVEMNPTSNVVYLRNEQTKAAFYKENPRYRILPKCRDPETESKPTIDSYLSRALNCYQLDKDNQARSVYDKAVAAYPNSYEVRMGRADFNRWSDDYSLALEDYGLAIKINPNYYDAYLARGHCYSAMKKYDLSLVDYTKAIDLYPYAAGDPNYYRGWAYLRLGNYDAAISDFTVAIRSQPTNSYYYEGRASAYKKINRRDLEAADRQKVKELEGRR